MCCLLHHNILSAGEKVTTISRKRCLPTWIDALSSDLLCVCQPLYYKKKKKKSHSRISAIKFFLKSFTLSPTEILWGLKYFQSSDKSVDSSLSFIIARTSSVLSLTSCAHSSITHWHLSVISVGFSILRIISTEFISFHYIAPITSSHLAPYPSLHAVMRTCRLPVLYAVCQSSRVESRKFEYFSTINKRLCLFPLLFAIDLPPVTQHQLRGTFF